MLNRTKRQRYALRLLRALIGYGLVLALYLFAMWANIDETSRTLLSITHLLAAGYLASYFVRFFLSTDELQRRMQTEAITFAFGGTALLALGYGFLESLGIPHIGWIYLFPIMVVLWFAGMNIAERRYE